MGPTKFPKAQLMLLKLQNLRRSKRLEKKRKVYRKKKRMMRVKTHPAPMQKEMKLRRL